MDSISFGTLPYASDLYDEGIDQLNLPVGPGAPDAYFLLDDARKLRRDVRNFGDTLVYWTARFTGSDGWVKWNPALVWDGLWINGTVNMTTDSLFFVRDGAEVIITYRHNLSRTWNITLSRGWNIISLPVTLSDQSFTSLFPSCVDAAYTYNPVTRGYVTHSVLESGRGYWVLSRTDTTYTRTGAPLYNYTHNLGKAGIWLVRFSERLISGISMLCRIRFLTGICGNICLRLLQDIPVR